MGTGGEEGQEGALYRLDHGAITKYQTAEGLVANDVRLSTEDRKGAIWIGTTDGLSRFADTRLTNYTTEQGLSHNYVPDVEDSDGTLIGTEVASSAGRKFVSITTQMDCSTTSSRDLADENDYFDELHRGLSVTSVK